MQQPSVQCARGGKEVHAADVAKATELLLHADNVTGESFNCCDRYVSDFEVATIAQRVSGSRCAVEGEPRQPKHQIDTSKIEKLGMQFGGTALLEDTVAQLVHFVGQAAASE